ncbi:hypothetical protein LshimejAT787_0302980 [Lyophyllum shimeji]|uniref:Uncharacterized protein n=1 Tax=Lyophyllum shimeji TaxID=47721 RepID=A0A9P3ULU7_LYOSH|nr:hypothetical protein LshimejAT787_0302980 [Lyophyllum shimeji]
MSYNEGCLSDSLSGFIQGTINASEQPRVPCKNGFYISQKFVVSRLLWCSSLEVFRDGLCAGDFLESISSHRHPPKMAPERQPF